MTRFSDLSPAEQRQIRSGSGRVIPPSKPRPPRKPKADLRHDPHWECSRCRAQFVYLEGPSGIEAHMDDEHHGGRYDIIIREISR